MSRSAEIGRQAGFRNLCPFKGRVGSSPTFDTNELYFIFGIRNIIEDINQWIGPIILPTQLD